MRKKIIHPGHVNWHALPGYVKSSISMLPNGAAVNTTRQDIRVVL